MGMSYKYLSDQAEISYGETESKATHFIDELTFALNCDGADCKQSGKAFLDFFLSLDELLDWREQLKQAEAAEVLAEERKAILREGEKWEREGR
jgi:hypothetical protein